MSNVRPLEIIKKYSNRKLYHSGTKSYVNYTWLRNLIRKDNADVKVVVCEVTSRNRAGGIESQEERDITKETLLRMTYEEQKKELNNLSIEELTARIRA